MEDYFDILDNPIIDKESLGFRRLNSQAYKARYKKLLPLDVTNAFLNIPIAASVTAHAQVKLMRQMLRIGPERVLYCDTDSIIYLWRKSWECLNSDGLGNWVSEVSKNDLLVAFIAIAPKCYIELFEKEGEHLKCKGICTTEENREKVSFDAFYKLLKNTYEKNFERPDIVTTTMTIHTNSTCKYVPYGVLCTTYGEKSVRIVFSKREMVDKEENDQLEQMKIIYLKPFNYQGQNFNIKK